MAEPFLEKLQQQVAAAAVAEAQEREVQRITEAYASVIAAGYRRPWPVSYKVEAVDPGPRGEDLQRVLDERAEEGWRVKAILDRTALLVIFEQDVTIG